jgi:diaminopimelate decarboxylase
MLEAILLGEVSVNGRSMKTLDALAAADTPTLVIEPGRSIVGDAGMTFLRTAFLKTIARHHHMLAMEMGVVFYGEAMVGLPAMKWAIATEPNRRDPQPFETFVAGNLCFNADMLSRIKLPLQRKPVRGDVLMIASTGAYAPTFVAANANSFPRPARILIEADGSWSYTHRRDTYDEIFSLKGS